MVARSRRWLLSACDLIHSLPAVTSPFEAGTVMRVLIHPDSLVLGRRPQERKEVSVTLSGTGDGCLFIVEGAESKNGHGCQLCCDEQSLVFFGYVTVVLKSVTEYVREKQSKSGLNNRSPSSRARFGLFSCILQMYTRPFS